MNKTDRTDGGRILVMAAMPKEEVAIKQNLAMAELGADVFQTGIGKVNAGICTTAMLHARRRACVLSVGCSGALDPELKPGDIVVGTDTAYWDVNCGGGCTIGQIQGCPMFFHCDLTLRDLIFDALKRDGFRPKCGLMLTGDLFVTDERHASRVRGLYPCGTTIDMETAAVAHTCWRFGIPFAAVRVISDSPNAGDGMSRAEEYHGFWVDGGTADRFAFVRSAVRAAHGFARIWDETVAGVEDVEKGLMKCLADA